MNQSPIDAKTIARKAYRDSLQDGLVELSSGIGMLLLGIFTQSKIFAYVVLVAVFVPLLVRRLKERYTYPRIGYVVFPEKSRKQGPLIAILLGVAVIAIGAVIVLVGKVDQPGAWYRWTPLLPAIVFQAAFLPMAVKSGIKRFYVISALTLLLGLVAVLPNLPGSMDNLWIYLVTMGAILTVWGTILLVTFLRKHPRQQEEAQSAG